MDLNRSTPKYIIINEDIMISDFKLYYKIIEIRTIWYWRENTHSSKEQYTNLRNKSTFTWSINLWQRKKNIQWENDSLLKNGVGKTGQIYVKKLRPGHLFL